MPTRTAPIALLATVLGAAVAAQDFDARDVVRTTKGEEIRGRVSRRHDPRTGADSNTRVPRPISFTVSVTAIESSRATAVTISA